MMMGPDEYIARLDELTSGYQRAQVVFTALKAGVFSLLETPRTAGETATSLGWSARGARMLLDGLVALELAEKRDGRYRNTAAASHCLVPGAPADQTHIIAHRANCRATWDRLDEAVRTGSSACERTERTAEELRDFIRGMADIARQSARAVLESIDLSPYQRMLDVAAGPASYTIAFLEANPGLRGTVFDLPDVIPIAREEAEAAGQAGRIKFIAGDLTRDPFGSGYDLVFVSNIIHSFGAEDNRNLAKKCYDALESGGLLVIKDFLLDAGRPGPPFGLMFALHMLVSTEAGDTYTLDEVGEWCAEAGFSPGEFVDLTPQTRLWLARKP